MGIRIKALLVAGVMLALLLPVPTQASEQPEIVITEIKLGGAVAGQPTEFIQIYNQSTQDATDLKIEYAKAAANITDCALPWKAQDSTNVREVVISQIIPANTAVIVEIAMTDNSGGSLRISDETQSYDTVGWGKNSSIGKCAEGDFAVTPSNFKSLKRYFDGEGLPVDTNNNQKDLITDQLPLTNEPPVLSDEGQPCVNEECPQQEPAAPVPNECSLVQLSEILPNPSGADTNNEFIELYNPAAEPLSLNGCYLKVGTSKKALSGTLAAQSYIAVYGLTLPNAAGGTVEYISFDTEEVVTYPADMRDDEAWALINGAWQITNQPTPDQPNMPSIVVIQSATNTQLQPCPAGKFRNPETNRCKTIEEAGHAPCAPGQVRNPETNRCRKVTASSLTSLKPCSPGQERNPETNRCRKVGASASSLKPCAPGQERNPETNRCRKVAGASTNQASVNGSKPQNNATKISYGLFAMLAVVVIGYGAYEYRTEMASFFSRLKPSKK